MSVRDDEIITVLMENLPDTALAIDDYDRPFIEYGVDSFDSMALLLAVEKKFGFKIPDADVDALNTTNTVVNYVKKRLSREP